MLPYRKKKQKPYGLHPRHALSAAFVRQVAEAGRYCDGDGLYLEVHPTGRKYWLQRLVIRKRRCELGLGSFPLVSLRKARAQAFANRKLARAGGDPLAAKRRAGVPSQREYRDQWDEPERRTSLEPSERFPDVKASEDDRKRLCPGIGPAETGANASAVRDLLANGCAGWRKHPSSLEFHEAVRATAPTGRQRHLITTWGNEASITEIILGWAQGAYTIREMVRALKRADFTNAGRIRTINRWVMR